MPHARLIFLLHAIQRMFEREVGKDDVTARVLETANFAAPTGVDVDERRYVA